MSKGYSVRGDPSTFRREGQGGGLETGMRALTFYSTTPYCLWSKEGCGENAESVCGQMDSRHPVSSVELVAAN